MRLFVKALLINNALSDKICREELSAKFSFKANTVCKLICGVLNAPVTFFLSLMPLKKWRLKVKVKSETFGQNCHWQYQPPSEIQIYSQQRRKLSQPVEGSSTPSPSLSTSVGQSVRQSAQIWENEEENISCRQKNESCDRMNDWRNRKWTLTDQTDHQQQILFLALSSNYDQ